MPCTTLRLSMLGSAALLMLCAGGSVQAQQAPQAPNMTFFVTSVGSGKGADLGGSRRRGCALSEGSAATVGAGGKTWRAYLSTNAQAQGGAVNARDRIGKGPWQNSKGVVVATSVEDLHSDNNKLGADNTLTERGTKTPVFGYTPNYHDILTGSDMEGKAFPGNMNLTCNNWTSSTAGTAMLGHLDRHGGAETVYQHSWNAAHQSRDCTQDGLRATGGNGLTYCFAQ